MRCYDPLPLPAFQVSTIFLTGVSTDSESPLSISTTPPPPPPTTIACGKSKGRPNSIKPKTSKPKSGTLAKAAASAAAAAGAAAGSAAAYAAYGYSFQAVNKTSGGPT